jgi:hypothetical protein
MTPTRQYRVRAWLGLALLSCGLLPGTCAIRAKEAFVDGTKLFIADTLLNPSNISELSFEDVTGSFAGL